MRKTAVVALVALGLGFLAGWSLAPSRTALLPPPAPGLPDDVESLRAKLGDAEASAALLRREIADQDRRRQGLEAQLASGPVADTGKAPAVHDWDRKEPECDWKKDLQASLRRQIHYKFEDIPFKDAKEYLEAQGCVVINVDKLGLEAIPALNNTLIQLSSPDLEQIPKLPALDSR